MRKKIVIADQEYFFEQWIMRIGFIFLFLFFVFIYVSVGGKEYIHIYCPVNSWSACENPLYNNTRYLGYPNIDDQLINSPTIPKGFEINKPVWYVDDFKGIIFLTLSACFLINHFLYNKKFDFKKAWTYLSREVTE